ncbi:hypothetical protein J6J34_04550 [Pseudidiomarina sp. 1ASP75-14]|uniref:LPS-assembly lipoprotein LptE n=1 Tax=Pseudidiomarina terrestris TaxID=2820060 RepID=UPI00264EF543|nr:LPS assembly lipoprotein LptE [Pseudidiomarina sp. 1ASP75-14]MDN7137484.1 hypothetical protein [Pseudidiomarina sp. 1ASP75-14]
MRTLLLGLLMFLLVGCGFQLQGSYKLPDDLQQLRIAAPQFSEFADEARQRFQLAGAELVDDTAAVTVQILDDSLTRRTLSLSASGQVAEYELIYTVNYLLSRPEQADKALQIEVFRDYQDDPNFALAKTREREVLVAEMREQAAQQMVRQVIAQVSE